MRILSTLPDILFASTNSAESKRIARQLQAGSIRKVLPRVYTSDVAGRDEDIVRRNLWRLLEFRFPNALVSHRSAVEYGPSPGKNIYLTWVENRVVEWPGITVKVSVGPSALLGDRSPFPEGIRVSSEDRALLENLTTARKIGGEARTLERGAIEKRLLNILNTRGEEGLNAVRDSASVLAKKLAMQKEFQELDTIIGALLSTKSAGVLRSTFAVAHALGEPYDEGRIALFDVLVRALRDHVFPLRKERVNTGQAFANMAFFESYFSNYIEGTVFEVQQARDIIYHGARIPNRAGDSHDVKGTYALCSDREEMSLQPASSAELLTTLQRRHATLLGGRPEMWPGQFKERPNRAGSTWFVDPSQVVGTLKQGYERIDMLTDPLARALYIMFVASEVHPFNDGNGRIARVMMNAELVQQGCTKLIIPNVYREDYMLALRRLSRQQDPGPYIRMMDRAHAWSHWLTPTSFEDLNQQITDSNGYKEPDEASLSWLP
jgi:fido (protein-threonine AMPylation protein)